MIWGGFLLKGSHNNTPYELTWKPQALYSCHIEYDYGKLGDCIDLNTNNDTLYIYPQTKRCSVTKISLATEELYKMTQIQRRQKYDIAL